MTMPDTSLPQSTTPEPHPTAREQVRDLKDQAIGQARDTVRDARDRVASSLGDSKNRVADQIGGVAQAFRQASGQFRSEDQARIAGLADSVASQVDQLAAYLRNRDGRAMMNDLDNLAHRQPALVIGGAFALGMLAARFLKSSERRELNANAGNGGFNSGYENRFDGGFDRELTGGLDGD
jgi:hypothetical protein